MKNKIKQILKYSKTKAKVLLIFIVIFSFSLLAHFRGKGFHESKILSSLEYNPQWDISLEENEKKKILKILSQDFFYLNRGRQCFVFVSADKKYVIKFFNHRRFRVPDYFSYIPFFEKTCNKKREIRNNRLQFYFNSYKLAYEKLKEETGLIFVHLNKTTDLHKKIRIKDPCSGIHEMDLDAVEFVLQKKSEPILSYLQERMEKEGDIGFEKALDTFLQVIATRCNKNISDDDLDVAINFGFVEGKAIVFDSGRFYINENLKQSENFKREMLKSTKFFRRWLNKNYSEMINYFDQKVELLSENAKGE